MLTFCSAGQRAEVDAVAAAAKKSNVSVSLLETMLITRKNSMEDVAKNYSCEIQSSPAPYCTMMFLVLSKKNATESK